MYIIDTLPQQHKINKLSGEITIFKCTKFRVNKLSNTENYGYQFPKIIFDVKSDFSISYQDFHHKVT